MNPRPDPQRFSALLQEHRRIVFKVAGAYARVPADRDDLAQEIAAQAWRSFGRYDAARAKFSTWLYRIALNVAISQLRRERWRAGDRMESLDAHHVDSLAGGMAFEEPDDRIAALHALIDALDPLDRALMLLYLDDHPHAEMAAILGISESNVATKIHRIKHNLRNRMTAPPQEHDHGTR